MAGVASPPPPSTHPPALGGGLATVRAEDLVVGPWGARFRGRRFPCAIGRAGVVPARAKREGDQASPGGTWRLIGIYWRADRAAAPLTILPATPLGPRLGWSEAPDDSDYNRAVRHPHRLSADRMFRGDPLYDICIVTDHNRDPVIPCAGSAIFVHLWRRPRAPTAGCVAFRRTDLEWILKRWSRRSRLIFRSRGGL